MNHSEDDHKPHAKPTPDAGFSDGLDDDVPFAGETFASEEEFDDGPEGEFEGEGDSGEFANPNAPPDQGEGGKKKKRRRRRRKKKGGAGNPDAANPVGGAPIPQGEPVANTVASPVEPLDENLDFVEDTPGDTGDVGGSDTFDSGEFESEPFAEKVVEVPPAPPEPRQQDRGDRSGRDGHDRDRGGRDGREDRGGRDGRRDNRDGRDNRNDNRPPKPQHQPKPQFEAAADDHVEEGEAPDEVEDDDTLDAITPPHAAIDDEIAEEVAHPHEWKVMTWNDLIAKLYKPA